MRLPETVPGCIWRRDDGDPPARTIRANRSILQSLRAHLHSVRPLRTRRQQASLRCNLDALSVVTRAGKLWLLHNTPPSSCDPYPQVQHRTTLILQHASLPTRTRGRLALKYGAIKMRRRQVIRQRHRPLHRPRLPSFTHIHVYLNMQMRVHTKNHIHTHMHMRTEDKTCSHPPTGTAALQAIKTHNGGKQVQGMLC